MGVKITKMIELPTPRFYVNGKLICSSEIKDGVFELKIDVPPGEDYTLNTICSEDAKIIQKWKDNELSKD